MSYSDTKLFAKVEFYHQILFQKMLMFDCLDMAIQGKVCICFSTSTMKLYNIYRPAFP